jgi:polar amino acid transport system substrate-binding protein
MRVPRPGAGPATPLAALLSAAMLALAPQGSAAAGTDVPPLVMCYEDVAQRPWTTPDNSGLTFELLRRVEKQLGERFVYAAKPWRRCLEELRLGTVDAVIAAADSKPRRSFAAYPLLADGKADPARALFTDTVNVFLRVGGSGSWDGQTLTAPKQEVAVQSGYLVGSVLRERGYVTRELVKSADDGLRLLASGMFDVAVLQGLEASRLARSDARFRDRVVQAGPPYRVVEFYLVFNLAAYRSAPQRADAIWRAIAAARKSADYRRQASEAGVAEPP